MILVSAVCRPAGHKITKTLLSGLLRELCCSAGDSEETASALWAQRGGKREIYLIGFYSKI
jgi:hypothetical protein